MYFVCTTLFNTMSQLKTQPNKASVKDFVNAIKDPQKQADSRELLKMMGEITGNRPKMWGTSIIGFGSFHYRYASGREGDWFLTGFSPRKQALTLYIMEGFNRHASLLKKLGKHSTGKGCLYFKKLEDVDRKVLRDLIQSSVDLNRQ